MTATTPKIFYLIKDPAWDGLKPEKIHLFGSTYMTDESKEIIEQALNEGLEYMRKEMVYDEDIPFFYWTYTPKSSFIDSFVTPDLFARSFTMFRQWFELIVSNWCVNNNLSYKIERDKLSPTKEFYIKITITVTPAKTSLKTPKK